MNVASLLRPGPPLGARAGIALAIVAGALAATPGTGTASTDPAASCVQSATPSSAEGGSAAASPTTFGPLSSHPVVDITLSAGEVYTAERFPGATLVSSFLGGEQYAIDLVEDSGLVRWRRCIAAPWIMPLVGASAEGDASVLLYIAGSDSDSDTVRRIDLASGAAEAAPLSGVPVGASLLVWSESHALFESGAIDAPASEQSLVLVDLVTLETAPVPLPGPVAKGEVEVPSYTLTDDGIVGFGGDQIFATLGIFVDGAWSTDSAAIDAALPITMGVDDFDTMEIVAHSGSGATVWTVPGVTDPSREGFHDVTVGDVTLIAGCPERDADGFCTAETLLALDAATGEQLWSTSDYAAVFASGDGYALLNERPVGGSGSTPPAPTGYVMIDVATGQPVDGQRWPAGTFWMGCCSDMSFTIERGGAVITSDVTSLQVFLPVAFESLETATVTL